MFWGQLSSSEVAKSGLEPSYTKILLPKTKVDP